MHVISTYRWNIYIPNICTQLIGCEQVFFFPFVKAAGRSRSQSHCVQSSLMPESDFTNIFLQFIQTYKLLLQCEREKQKYDLQNKNEKFNREAKIIIISIPRWSFSFVFCYCSRITAARESWEMERSHISYLKKPQV